MLNIANSTTRRTWLSGNLFLRNDDLTGKCIVGVWNGVIQKTNTTNDLSYFDNPIENIGRITIHLFAACHFSARTNSHHPSIFKDNFIDRLIQHVSAAIDSTQSSKSLRQFAKSVQWVQVWTLSVASQRFAIQFDSVDQVMTWLLQITVDYKCKLK